MLLLQRRTLRSSDRRLKREGKRNTKLSSPKLEDANWAGKGGGGGASECTLILTEGDSAKSLAMAGISIVGRDKYGVFPFERKTFECERRWTRCIHENTEIQNIMKIMGLQVGKKYDDVSKLRYGHLMIMTDQDHDGSHIKGLIINFIHKFWPSLLLPARVFAGIYYSNYQSDQGHEKPMVFYTMPEYEEWRNGLSDQVKVGELNTTKVWVLQPQKKPKSISKVSSKILLICYGQTKR